MYIHIYVLLLLLPTSFPPLKAKVNRAASSPFKQKNMAVSTEHASFSLLSASHNFRNSSAYSTSNTVVVVVVLFRLVSLETVGLVVVAALSSSSERFDNFS
jgi:hypothetical protein